MPLTLNIAACEMKKFNYEKAKIIYTNVIPNKEEKYYKKIILIKVHWY